MTTFKERATEVEAAIREALNQHDYFTAAEIALAETDLMNGDGTPYFGQRGLAYSNLALAQELRKRSLIPMNMGVPW